MTLTPSITGFYLEQLYTGCLAEAAYYLESEGEAAIIDPMRETEPYLTLAAQRGAKIKYVFETHFHADFVSGHVDLSRKTGAPIIYGPGAETGFEAIVARDDQEFTLGNLTIRVLHTPGHTPESSCFLVLDQAGKEQVVFTGDTLFIGEVGRPDLAVKSDLSEQDLANMLYTSLHTKLMPLSDEVWVYPAHGAGSACGKNISDERFSTIGIQKRTNYALQAKNENEFVRLVTQDILPPPQYFAKAAALNKNGYTDIDLLLEERTQALELSDVLYAVEQGALILDTRSPADFAEGHIPGSLFIGLDGSFASWVGTLIEDLDQPLVILSHPGREKEAVLRLARVGYANALGFLQGGIDSWKKGGHPIQLVKQMEAEELESIYEDSQGRILDVRKPREFENQHMKGALSFPLDFINDHIEDLDKDETFYVHCRSGFRSMIAISILHRAGYKDLVNMEGGMLALEKTRLPQVVFPCQLRERK